MMILIVDEIEINFVENGKILLEIEETIIVGVENGMMDGNI
jgi:hypothetical protein